MVKTLNFGFHEKEAVKSFLKEFEPKATKTDFEEFRVKILDCTVTLYHTGKLTIQGKSEEEEKVKDLILEGLKLKETFLLGFDETGRSELTGPFVISGALGQTGLLRELRDSKKVRNIQDKFEVATKNSLANTIVSFNAEYIDSLRRKGWTMDAIEAETINILTALFKKFEGKKLDVKADGKPLKGVKPGVLFMVKGDDLEPVIGAASVLAKHFRNQSKDRKKRKTWKTKQ